MFDFAWSEILLIGAVALIAIGPKDMPAAIRTVTRMIKKARRMAAEFQTHVDEMVREADLGDVKKAFTDIRNLDVASALEKHVDPDRSIRSTFAEDPFKPTYPTPGPTLSPAGVAEGEVAVLEEVRVSTPPAGQTIAEPAVVSEPEKPAAPAFIPPGLVPPEPRKAAQPAEAPAFIPPEAVLQRRSRA
jgi:sec-independent protein translocase protein TatB